MNLNSSHLPVTRPAQAFCPSLDASASYGGSPSTVLEISDSQTSVPGPSNTGNEALCWGCGLRIVLPSNVPIFKCGWCGAITNLNTCVRQSGRFPWRRVRDRFFVCFLLTFICFIICGGIWAVYPVVFSVSYLCGVINCAITFMLSVATVSTFSLAAFTNAGSPPLVVWGSYPVVGKGHLENYTFCPYCSKPKPSTAHHCRSCRICVLDMDHHCPFIGNCVGAANHKYFVMFLISAVTSMVYVTFMTSYCVILTLPPIAGRATIHLLRSGGRNNSPTLGFLKEMMLQFLESDDLLSPRKLLLVYLFVASVSVQIGLVVLLWQQLCYIYEGTTYLSSLSSSDEHVDGKRDCQNIVRFFGCTFCNYSRCLLSSICKRDKIHEK